MAENAQDPGAAFVARVSSQEMRYAYQFSYSVRMIGEIAGRYRAAQDADPWAARAMLDAFYVHVRLVSEFLTHSTDGRDIGPRHLGVGDWVTPDLPEAERLARYWTIGSRFVVHFGHDRVPPDLADLRMFDVSADALIRMAQDVLTVAGTFVQAVEELVPSSGASLSIERMRAETLRSELDRSWDALRAGQAGE